MVSKENILEFIKNHKNQLFRKFNLTKIGLFGSYSNGNANENSDIDLIVEFETDTQNLYEKKMELKQFFKKQFNKDVDVCREKYLKPYFKNQILESAIYV